MKHPKVRGPSGTDPRAGTHLRVRERRPVPNNPGQGSRCRRPQPKGEKHRAEAQSPLPQLMRPKPDARPPPAPIAATGVEARRGRPRPFEGCENRDEPRETAEERPESPKTCNRRRRCPEVINSRRSSCPIAVLDSSAVGKLSCRRSTLLKICGGPAPLDEEAGHRPLDPGLDGHLLLP